MKVELRRRVHDDHVTVHHDLVLICESEEESRKLDHLGNAVKGARVEGELRLADGYREHYILLHPVAADG